jgi:small subunit ribosomal protein S4
VNGKRVTIPSYLVEDGDVVTLKDRSRELAAVMAASGSTEREAPDYVEVDAGRGEGRFLRTPKLSDVPYAVQMEPNLVVEFYSR